MWAERTDTPAPASAAPSSWSRPGRSWARTSSTVASLLAPGTTRARAWPGVPIDACPEGRGHVGPAPVEGDERRPVATAEAGQAALDAGGVGHGAARRLDVPLVDRDAVDGAQDRGAHGVALRGEQPGGVGEQAHPVEVGDVEAVRAPGAR